jgi:hypothetical protein
MQAADEVFNIFACLAWLFVLGSPTSAGVVRGDCAWNVQTLAA